MPDRSADLILTAVTAVLAAAVVILGPLPRALPTLFGLPLVLLLPGYALGRALFPRGRLTWAERIVLSLTLSVTAAICAGLTLNIVGLRLATGSWGVVLSATTVAACAVAMRWAPATSSEGPRLRAPRVSDATLVLAAVLVAGGAFALGRTPLHPPDAVRGYTELSQVRDGRTIRLQVTADEFRPARYRLELRSSGRVATRWRLPKLDPGERWSAAISGRRLRRRTTLEARLYQRGSSTPYRRVRLKPPPRR